MPPKHIAIVGFGSAALAVLKALQDLPYELRYGWRVTIYERREALGGQWLLDESGSETPLSGLYERLRTNTPSNMMTYPHEPFPDNTDLFPHWKVVLIYLQEYARKWGMFDSSEQDWNAAVSASTSNGHIQNHAVPLRPQNTPPDVARRQLPRRILYKRELYSTTWVKPQAGKEGFWRAISRPFPSNPDDLEYTDHIDVIIDATGHLVHPFIPFLPGKEEWLQNESGRKVVHSAYYRGPEPFTDKTVLIVGSGPSGLDGALQIGTTARKVYHAMNPAVVLPPSWPFERTARLAGFSKDAVLLGDGTQIDEIDTVYLGTGFIIRYEYLERGGALVRRPGCVLPDLEDEEFNGLVSTDLYVRPLYEHTMSFAESHGPASLFWCGNIMSTSYRLSNAVQAALIAWSLAVPSIIPSRSEMQDALRAHEDRTRALGRTIEKLGQRQGRPEAGESEIYQHRIIDFLKSHGIEPGNSEERTGIVLEPWREEVRKDFWMCMRGWARLEREGRTKDLLRTAAGEMGFADLSRLVIEEQRQVEIQQGRDPLEQNISGWS